MISMTGFKILVRSSDKKSWNVNGFKYTQNILFWHLLLIGNMNRAIKILKNRFKILTIGKSWKIPSFWAKFHENFMSKKKTSPDVKQITPNPYMELFFAWRSNFPCKLFQNGRKFSELSFLTFPGIFSRFLVNFTFFQISLLLIIASPCYYYHLKSKCQRNMLGSHLTPENENF